MGEVGGNYRVQNQDEASSSAAAGLTNHINFPSSTSRFMPSIPENVNDNAHKFSSENGRSRNGNGREFQITQDSWNESPGLKRTRDGDLKSFSKFNGLENEVAILILPLLCFTWILSQILIHVFFLFFKQNGETRKKASGLVSHLSLPKTSAEMAVVENMLQFQQETTIPCQIRAKRGFATHPRSIAERVYKSFTTSWPLYIHCYSFLDYINIRYADSQNRRTRISDNMKKLQDLFPDMDKVKL